MQPRRHRKGHKWRKFAREKRSLCFALFFLVLALALLVLLLWLMSGIRFVNAV